MSTVHLPTVARWILARHVSQPFFWVWFAGLAALWPAVLFWSPLGITSAERGNDGVLYELAFLGLLVGVCFGLDALARGGWILDQASAWTRLRVEALGVLLSALMFLAAGLVVPLALGSLRSAPGPGSGAWPLYIGGSLSLFHLSALALVLRRLPLAPNLHCAWLPLLAWALPATLGENPVGDSARLWLDASRHLEGGHGIDSLGTVFGTALAPIIVLLLVASLIALHPRRHS